MARLFYGVGRFLFVSRSRKNVRRGLVGLLTNLLVLAGVVFGLEIVLILLGTGDVFLPIAASTRDFFAAIVF
ncbi:MAG: hypothetical protein GF418_06160 [Chitinivibrionales bacterium]|nr:hypothetical protein [Chitinivibrionales bacterium]MBD3395195.1 hypothetical protein [Chitinivibrionales bacterium]